MLATSHLKGRSIGERSIRVLPGQYYDAETGTHYNNFRDYDLVLPTNGGHLTRRIHRLERQRGLVANR